MKKKTPRKIKPEINPLPNIPNVPERNPEIIPNPEKSDPYYPIPEIMPRTNPEINPYKKL